MSEGMHDPINSPFQPDALADFSVTLDRLILAGDAEGIESLRLNMVTAIDTFITGRMSELVQVETVSVDENLSFIKDNTMAETEETTESASADEPYIPSLLDRLEHSSSVHEHKYNDVCVHDALKEIPENGRTEEQERLLSSVDTLARFAGPSTLYRFVYKPTEVVDLAEKLEVLEAKNRPDFDGVEGDLVDVASKLIHGDPERFSPSQRSIREIVKRAAQNQEGRRGMQFGTLVKVAAEANAILAEAMMASEERRDYHIHVTDPNRRESIDLSQVFQFVANYHAYNVVLDRSRVASQENAAVFERNCEIIDDYFKEIEPLLESMPRDIKIEKSFGFKRSREIIRRYRPVQYLQHLQSVMHERLANGKNGSGASKGYLLDPMGAYRLQRLIGHTINQINEVLASRDQDTTIVPLEELDIDL